MALDCRAVEKAIMGEERRMCIVETPSTTKVIIGSGEGRKIICDVVQKEVRWGQEGEMRDGRTGCKYKVPNTPCLGRHHRILDAVLRKAGDLADRLKCRGCTLSIVEDQDRLDLRLRKCFSFAATLVREPDVNCEGRPCVPRWQIGKIANWRETAPAD